MMNSATTCKIPWVRDEVILALAIIVMEEQYNFSPEHEICKKLSEMLNALPLIPEEKRNSTFRNANGMSYQMGKFGRVIYGLREPSHIGTIWYNTWLEFREKKDLLLKIYQTILNNISFIQKIPKCYFNTDTVFFEGSILEALHCFMEKQCLKIAYSNHCEICGMFPTSVYRISPDGILEHHILIPPENMIASKRIEDDLVVTVCPTCHKVLHFVRPWHQKKDFTKILSWS